MTRCVCVCVEGGGGGVVYVWGYLFSPVGQSRSPADKTGCAGYTPHSPPSARKDDQGFYLRYYICSQHT